MIAAQIGDSFSTLTNSIENHQCFGNAQIGFAGACYTRWFTTQRTCKKVLATKIDLYKAILMRLMLW